MIQTIDITSNPREACHIINGRVEVSLDNLDLNYQPSISIPQWQPTQQLEPYENSKKALPRH